MSLLDEFTTVGDDRKPGDFRRTERGAPKVSHPTKTTKHDGKKDDLLALCAERGINVPDKVTVAQLHELLGERPQTVVYGRPSGFGGALDPDPYNLKKWNERQLLIGVAVLLDLDWSQVQL